ncbi:hypothetical protein [Streptomyces sp. RKAG290]|uniref:hypothetical protein n=1 Tax=Streptomyces sp. RKAG290 TaxID=2888348 RepID=UPI002034A5D5|nr:hypothetical protein [Streptomyces sp. RKAG290]MCM2413077.1 hypothetical protein [Streptomyces sp. RKAG290]
MKEATAEFEAWRASVPLNAIDVPSVRSNGYAFQVETDHRAVGLGLRIVEVPIRFGERGSGASKPGLRAQFESALVP